MKTLYLLFVALLLFQIQCQEKYCSDDINPSSKGDCNKLAFDDSEKNIMKYCCFAKGKEMGVISSEKKDFKECWSLTEALYDKIKDYIKGLEESGIYDDLSVECGANYIVISLLSLILQLL